jgi:hypothetical protein
MNFEYKVGSIRSKIKSYTTESFIDHLLRRLHKKNKDGKSNVYESWPWVTCLALDWALELEQSDYAKNATAEDVEEILNKIWILQGKIIDFKKSEKIEFNIRPFFLNQLKFQKNQITHLYFMTRLYEIIYDENKKKSYYSVFYRETGIDLEDFFIFCYMMYIIFSNQRTSYCNYSLLILNLYPHFSINMILKMINLVGATPMSLRNILIKWRSNNPLRQSEFFSEPFTLKKPILLLPKGFTTPHSYIATIGVSEFIMRTFKEKYPEFKNKFTKDYEEYISDVFLKFNASIVRENELKDFYRSVACEGKVADFLLKEGTKNIYVDAKGTEPHELTLITSNPKIIKDKLKSAHMKAIVQTCECANILYENNYEGSASYEDRYSLVVTNQDYYLGDGKTLKEYLGEEFDNVLRFSEEKIPLENIHFISVEDFEGVLKLCHDIGKPLYDFLDYCREMNSSFNTKVFYMRQHIESYSVLNGSNLTSPIGCDRLLKANSRLASKLSDISKKCIKYWQKGGDVRVWEMIKLLKNFD